MCITRPAHGPYLVPTYQQHSLVFACVPSDMVQVFVILAYATTSKSAALDLESSQNGNIGRIITLAVAVFLRRRALHYSFPGK